MSSRIEYAKIAPEAIKAMVCFQQQIDTSSLDSRLVHLVDVRVSQINGCAY